jgi:hypothetical protein
MDNAIPGEELFRPDSVSSWLIKLRAMMKMNGASLVLQVVAKTFH